MSRTTGYEWAMRDSNPRPLPCELFPGSSYVPYTNTGVRLATAVALMRSVGTHDTQIPEDASEDQPGSNSASGDRAMLGVGLAVVTIGPGSPSSLVHGAAMDWR
jgi:hypothetical protein